MSPRTLVAAAAAPLLALALTAPASAGSFPDTVPLPDASSPEGITDGPGTTFFAGSRNTGAVYVADARTGEGRFLVEPQEPVAGLTRVVGLDYDAARKTVVTAGGTTGLVTTYDSRTGAELSAARVPGDPGSRFLNDVVTDAGVSYVTDSRNPELVVVRGDRATVVPLTGDYVQPAGFGANGIVDVPGPEVLLVSGGVLYEVDPATGVADALEQTGGPELTSGDGLELVGSTLYVTYGFGRDSIAVARLGAGSETFRVTGELVDEDLQRPTTSAFVAGALYGVNGKFGDPGATEFEVVRVQR